MNSKSADMQRANKYGGQFTRWLSGNLDLTKGNLYLIIRAKFIYRKPVCTNLNELKVNYVLNCFRISQKVYKYTEHN